MRKTPSGSRPSAHSAGALAAGRHRARRGVLPKQLIGNLGYDPTYGARPLGPGDTVRLDAADGELVFDKARAGAQPVTA